jgi:hypothetical protein
LTGESEVATYTVTTTRQQEVGLKYSYDTYADKTVYTTQQAWLQLHVDSSVTNPMFVQQQEASSRSFDESLLLSQKLNNLPQKQKLKLV